MEMGAPKISDTDSLYQKALLSNPGLTRVDFDKQREDILNAHKHHTMTNVDGVMMADLSPEEIRQLEESRKDLHN